MGQNEQATGVSAVVKSQFIDAAALQIENNIIGHKIKTNQNDSAENPTAFQDRNVPICRICHCSNEDIVEQYEQTKNCWPIEHNADNKVKLNNPLSFITPCYCTGSLQYVHHKCLQQWIRSSNHKYCEVCKYSFKLKTKNKPLYQWECFSMTKSERRKFFLHFLFNILSMFIVFWSIYLIILRASFELNGRINWFFWTKMIIILSGFICGLMFIFFQLKLYLSILIRWKQYNQIVVIENVDKDLSKKNDDSVYIDNLQQQDK